ncbi:MAG: hypothetical protein WCK90_02355 [archaeon]
MVKPRDHARSGNGRKLVTTILLGIFVTIMLTILINLIISYAYEGPQYDKYCKTNYYQPSAPLKVPTCYNCTYPLGMQVEEQNCSMSGGIAVYSYNEYGCPVSVDRCDTCNNDYNKSMEIYNRRVFFVYAIVGFALIIFGLFSASLLLQIVTLPSGAFLVIEAAVKNFDDKLMVIITFGLLIALALYLAVKKLKLN